MSIAWILLLCFFSHWELEKLLGETELSRTFLIISKRISRFSILFKVVLYALFLCREFGFHLDKVVSSVRKYSSNLTILVLYDTHGWGVYVVCMHVDTHANFHVHSWGQTHRAVEYKVLERRVCVVLLPAVSKTLSMVLNIVAQNKYWWINSECVTVLRIVFLVKIL